MSELVKSLIPTAIKVGIPIKDFWDYDFQELQDTVTAYTELQQELQKVELSKIYSLADLTAMFTGYVFSGKKHPSISEIYPTVFNGESDEQGKVEKFQQEFLAFTELFNQNRKGE